MAESAPVSNPGIQRRRSSRVVQAVPITVGGVDALGRAFQERTSTHSINCHGARFHSKHYVLKNTWMVVEVPPNEADGEPKRVRARVMWVQRPRNVRELFQVSVELESPGNVWGISFPPDDWFDSSLLTSDMHVSEPGVVEPGDGTIDFLPAAPPGSHMPARPSTEEVKLAAAEQVNKVVEQAREELHEYVRHATDQAMAGAADRLFRELNGQLAEAARRAVEGLAGTQAESTALRVSEQIERARQEGLEALRRAWKEDFDRIQQQSLKQLREKLDEMVDQTSGRLAVESPRGNRHLEMTPREMGDWGANLQAAAASRLRLFEEQLMDVAEKTRREWMERMQSHAEQARLHLAELERATKTLDLDIASATTDLQSGWRARLDAEMAAAEQQWSDRLELSIASAAQRAAERLMGAQEGLVEKTARQLDERVASVRGRLDAAVGEAEQAAAELRSSLGQETFWAKAALAELEQAATRLEGHTAKIESSTHSALEDFDRKLTERGTKYEGELEKKFERRLESLGAKVEEALQIAATPVLERLTSEIESELSERLAGAREILSRLGETRGVAEEALQEHKLRLQNVSQEALREAMSHLREMTSQLGTENERVGREALARTQEELETKAADIRHTTFEALYNSSEWYQKKSVNQIQTALEKALEQAAASLREKAAESSRLFASEIERCTRSYAEHAQGMLTDGATELVERTQARLAAAAETASGVFTDDARRISDEAIERLTEVRKEAVDETVGKIEEAAQQAAMRIAAQTAISATEFEMEITGRRLEALDEAKKEFSQKLEALAVEWEGRRATQERATLERLERASDDSTREFERLAMESTSRLEKLSGETLERVERLRSETADELVQLRGDSLDRVQELQEKAMGELGRWKENATTELQGLREDSETGIRNLGVELSGRLEQAGGEASRQVERAARETVERLQGRGGEAVARIESLTGESAERLEKLSSDSLAWIERQSADALGQIEQKQKEALGQIERQRDDSTGAIEHLHRRTSEQLQRDTDESVHKYRERLENVANSWMVTAVTTLDQQSKNLLDELARDAEERLRRTCSNLFSGLAETMRQRLLGISSDLDVESGGRSPSAD